MDKTLCINFTVNCVCFDYKIKVKSGIKMMGFSDPRDFMSIGLYAYELPEFNSDLVHVCEFETVDGIIDCVLDLKVKPTSMSII